MSVDSDIVTVGTPWNAARPRVLVIACSDGRLQEATDEFLARRLGIRHYDRLYVPGGAGALSASGRDYYRARRFREECRYLVGVHGVERMIAIFHGPASDGPELAICADYRRKFGWATLEGIRTQQDRDARELIQHRHAWADRAAVHIYRCEVGAATELSFVTVHTDSHAAAAQPR